MPFLNHYSRLHNYVRAVFFCMSKDSLVWVQIPQNLRVCNKEMLIFLTHDFMGSELYSCNKMTLFTTVQFCRHGHILRSLAYRGHGFTADIPSRRQVGTSAIRHIWTVRLISRSVNTVAPRNERTKPTRNNRGSWGNWKVSCSELSPKNVVMLAALTPIWDFIHCVFTPLFSTNGVI